MRKVILAVFSQLFFYVIAHACLNEETKILKNGTLLYWDNDPNVPHGHNFNNQQYYQEKIGILDSVYNKTKDLDYLSDKGLLLIVLKRYDEAIELYLWIEKVEPNRYSTASNIGTAYELIGQDKQALKWIRKSVDIDPSSHKNSEWIHVNILEAKIKGEEFCTTYNLLKTGFGNEAMPEASLTGEEIDKMSTSLVYQLNERISFVKPKEKIVAQLLFDLGNMAILRGRIFNAKDDYKLAMEYGYTGALINARMKEADRLYNLRGKEMEKLIDKRIKTDYSLLIIFAIVFLIIAIIISHELKKKNTIQ